MNKEQIEKIFELGAQAQYECADHQGCVQDYNNYERLKDEAVKLFSIHGVVKSSYNIKKDKNGTTKKQKKNLVGIPGFTNN